MKITISVVRQISTEVEDGLSPDDAIAEAILEARRQKLLDRGAPIVRYALEISPLELYLCHDSSHWQMLHEDIRQGAGEFNLDHYLSKLPPRKTQVNPESAQNNNHVKSTTEPRRTRNGTV